MRIFGYLLFESCIFGIESCILKDLVQTRPNGCLFYKLQANIGFLSKSKIVLLIAGFAIDFLMEETHNKDRKIF